MRLSSFYGAFSTHPLQYPWSDSIRLMFSRRQVTFEKFED